MKVNINTKVSVVLKKEGADAINNWWKRLGFDNPDGIYKEGDVYTAPLWDVMQKIGSSIYMGKPVPMDMEIDIDV